MQEQALTLTKKIGLFAGPIAFIILSNIQWDAPQLAPAASQVIATGAFMLIWWISEAVPLPVTALLPIVLFPYSGVMSIKEATSSYGSHIIFLFMGGFVIARAMEKWNLHRRISLAIVKITGVNPNGIILGFMISTAFLSMWISNTATTVMMLPIALSVIGLLIPIEDKSSHSSKNFALCIMLGIAYAANIGGVATLIGTPPNSVFAGFIEKQYGYEVNFLKWLLLGFPFSCILLTITFFILTKVLYTNKLSSLGASREMIVEEYTKLGKMNKGEKSVLYVFVGTALLWISRSYINPLFPLVQLTDPGIAMTGAIATFLVPVSFKKGEFLLTWKDAEQLPWGILLLFGGGLALAGAMQQVGLIDLIGDSVSHVDLPALLIIGILTTIVLFMTEVMSNVALITVFLPILAGIAQGLGFEELHLIIPATIASSCAFMLPMSTPPNAIVFASGHIKVPQMVKAGIILNVIAILILIVFARYFIPLIF